MMLALVVGAGCKSAPSAAPAAAPAPAPAPASSTATAQERPAPPARDPEMERQVARLRVQLLERDAQIAELQRQLGDATTEVVRAMARLRTLATRAEAASAMAEAQVTIQQLKGRAGEPPPEARQAEISLQAASREFDAENYGGALYLATQAKRTATVGRGRLAESGGTSREGERAFAVPVSLQTTGRANLRAGPGGSFDVVEAVAAGTSLTATAYVGDWMRVTSSDGRDAWVHVSAVRGAARN